MPRETQKVAQPVVRIESNTRSGDGRQILGFKVYSQDDTSGEVSLTGRAVDGHGHRYSASDVQVVLCPSRIRVRPGSPGHGEARVRSSRNVKTQFRVGIFAEWASIERPTSARPQTTSSSSACLSQQSQTNLPSSSVSANASAKSANASAATTTIKSGVNSDVASSVPVQSSPNDRARPTKDGAATVPSSDKRRERFAFIFVGDTSEYWYQQPFVDAGVRRDVNSLRSFFAEKGYNVSVINGAKKSDVLNDLRTADAVAFIGHNGTPGKGFAFATGDEDYVTPLDIAQAINGNEKVTTQQAAIAGRHLDYAIFHVCEADNTDFHDATVGNGGGYYFAPKNYWNAVLNTEWFMGWKKLKYPRPY